MNPEQMTEEVVEIIKKDSGEQVRRAGLCHIHGQTKSDLTNYFKQALRQAPDVKKD